jgi:hypothetical protein
MEINSELFYQLITSPTTTVGLCCIGIKLATMFVLVCFKSNYVGGMPKFCVLPISSISHL